MGCLRQRGKKGIWWLRYYRGGRLIEESAGTTSKTEAARQLKDREGDIAKGLPVTPQSNRLRFDQAVEAVIVDYRMNGRDTLVDVERRVKLHLLPAFRGRRMADITPSDYSAFAARRQAAGASNGEINRELAIVKRAIALAMRDRSLLVKPYIPMLREDNVRKGFFEEEDFQRVRAQLPEYLRGVVTFAYLTGWRVASEVLPLTWDRIDRKTKTIRLEPGETKNGEGRVLPYDLRPELVALVEVQWAERQTLAASGIETPFVFHRNGDPVKGFRKRWMTACRKAEVPGHLLHDFRRTAVRNFERDAVPRSVAMKITGHRTESIYRRYAIVSERDIREGLGRVRGVQPHMDKSMDTDASEAPALVAHSS